MPLRHGFDIVVRWDGVCWASFDEKVILTDRYLDMVLSGFSLPELIKRYPDEFWIVLLSRRSNDVLLVQAVGDLGDAEPARLELLHGV